MADNNNKRKYLTVEELEIQRQATLAVFTLKSIRDSSNDAWKALCRSDKDRKLSPSSRMGLRLRPQDRTRVGRMIIPSHSGSGSKALDSAQKLGVRKPKDGIVYPKAGARSIKVVRRSDLENAGMPEELVVQVMKSQANRIRIKASQLTGNMKAKSEAIIQRAKDRLEIMLALGFETVKQ